MCEEPRSDSGNGQMITSDYIPGVVSVKFHNLGPWGDTDSP